jgi:uncharacterized protein (DUF58 family)
VRPSPALLQELSRSRLLVGHAAPNFGTGERRSRDKGSGIEFADHRAYQSGDDLRRLDLQLKARLGEHFIRQYNPDQPLDVAILVDGSLSMGFGSPSKFEFAKGLAAALGFVGIAGGDRVQLGAHVGGKLHWSAKMQGARAAEILFAWLDAHQPAGAVSFGAAIRAAIPQLPRAGLLVMISDWWLPDIAGELMPLIAVPGIETLAIQVAAPEELDPGLLGEGAARLSDLETGHEVELSLDPETLRRYREALAERRALIRQSFLRMRGRFVELRSDDNLERTLLKDWRRTGLLT